MPRALPLIFVLNSFLLPGALAVTCYTLDQKAAPDYIPCNPDADGVNSHSACCSPNDACLASGLCLSTRNSEPNQLLWVDACTDRSFKNGACPSHCIDFNNLPMSTKFLHLMPCGNISDTWCCDYGSTTTAGLSQGVGTLIRQLPSVTGAVSSTTTTAAQSSAATSVCSTGSAHPANTGYIAAISVTSVAFGFTLVALLASLYRLHRLQRSNQALAPNSADHGSTLKRHKKLSVGMTYHELDRRTSPPQELQS